MYNQPDVGYKLQLPVAWPDAEKRLRAFEKEESMRFRKPSRLPPTRRESLIQAVQKAIAELPSVHDGLTYLKRTGWTCGFGGSSTATTQSGPTRTSSSPRCAEALRNRRASWFVPNKGCPPRGMYTFIIYIYIYIICIYAYFISVYILYICIPTQKEPQNPFKGALGLGWR